MTRTISKTRPTIARSSRQLTARDARRAIVIDFEGRKANRPLNSSGYVPLMPEAGDFGLQRYLALIGYSCRKDYRDAEVSLTLRAMHDHFRKGRSYRDLPRRGKRRWHAVLAHNRCDVEGTLELLLIATGAREWAPTA